MRALTAWSMTVNAMAQASTTAQATTGNARLPTDSTGWARWRRAGQPIRAMTAAITLWAIAICRAQAIWSPCPLATLVVDCRLSAARRKSPGCTVANPKCNCRPMRWMVRPIWP